jgi:hypothetical protein
MSGSMVDGWRRLYVPGQVYTGNTEKIQYGDWKSMKTTVETGINLSASEDSRLVDAIGS